MRSRKMARKLSTSASTFIAASVACGNLACGYKTRMWRRKWGIDFLTLSVEVRYSIQLSLQVAEGRMIPMFGREKSPSDETFGEFRRKVVAAEVLSAAMERILKALRFSGRISVVVQNGKILKSGYEESYFTRREDIRDIP
jgi:hypothetical protein